jgi:hypothetical protein
LVEARTKQDEAVRELVQVTGADKGRFLTFQGDETRKRG